MKLKLKRIEKGFKQGELAQILGISQQYLRKLELDIVDPRLTLMKRISEILETSVTELFDFN